MLETSQKLLTKGFHPATISDSLLHFASKAVEVLESMAIPVDLSDNASLLKSANTALNSKVYYHSQRFYRSDLPHAVTLAKFAWCTVSYSNIYMWINKKKMELLSCYSGVSMYWYCIYAQCITTCTQSLLWKYSLHYFVLVSLFSFQKAPTWIRNYLKHFRIARFKVD